MRGCTQLIREERYQISILKKDNYSQKEIADLLGRDKSTISRELIRNQGLRSYRFNMHPVQSLIFRRS